jgi:hypothetical protein
MLGKFTIIEDKEEVTESDNLQEIELDSNCYVNNKFIGTTVAKKATIKILNENEYELENKNIEVKLGIEHYNPAQTYIGKNIEIKNAKSIKPQIKINGSSTQTTRIGKNLFNGTLKAGLFLASNGVTFVQNNNYVCSEKFVSVISGETYSVSNKNEIAGIYYVLEYDENKNFIKANNNSAIAASFTTMISSNCCYVRVEIGNSSAAPTVESVEDFQIEKGPATEYEQYGTSPIENITGDIEIKDVGKNLVKQMNWKQLPSVSTGATVTSVNGYGTDYIAVDNTKQYIFSYLGTAGSRYIVYYDKDKNFLGYDTNLQINNFAKWSETGYVRLRVDCSQDSVTDFQLEIGLEATDCEPYKSQVETFPLGNQKLMKGSYLADNGMHHLRKQTTVNISNLVTLSNGNKGGVFSPSRKKSSVNNGLLCTKAREDKTIGFITGTFYENPASVVFVGDTNDTLETLKAKYDGAILEYALAKEEIVPYTTEQQEAWEKIKNLMLFEGTNNIKSEAELTITLGKEYIIEGKYKVPKPDTEEVSAHTTFTGYDNMKNFDIPYVDNNTYPKRLDDCLESLCQQVGLVLGSKTFPNNSYMIKGNPFTNGETCKTVLSHLVQLTGGFAEIDMENGNVYVRNFDISGDAVETIDGNNYDEFKPNNVFGPVNSIRIQMNSGVDGEETIKEAEGVTDENRCQITIADNYYLTSAEERQAVINGIFNALNGLTYLPIELSYYGYPWLKLGNKIKVKDKNDKEYITYVMEHTLKYNGAYSGIIKATALTKTQVAYTETLSIKQWKRKTELSVSKIEGKITQLTKETTENSQKLTQQEQDINGLKTKVSNIQDLTQTTIGNKTIILSNCAKGDLLSLKIKGNNTVFKYLYPSEALYPTDDLYPAGDSRILVNDIQYELGVLDTLRQNGEVYDEFILEKRTSKSYA